MQLLKMSCPSNSRSAERLNRDMISFVQNLCQQLAALLIYHLRRLLLVECIDSCHAARRPLAHAVHILRNQVVVVEALQDWVREIGEWYRLVEDDARAEFDQVVVDSSAGLQRCKNNLVVVLQGLAEDS